STSTSSSCGTMMPSRTPPVWLSVRRSAVEGQSGDDEEIERLAAKVKQSDGNRLGYGGQKMRMKHNDRFWTPPLQLPRPPLQHRPLRVQGRARHRKK
ncbi:hypothetical protein PENTCL1PPCAC_21501, partial [Pristionchus entomophagus]